MTWTETRATQPDAGPGPERGLSIADVAERTGLSRDTLRYYEKAGLIGRVDRSTGGRRRYATKDLDWLTFLLRLRATGMPISGMQRFAELRRAGESSMHDRLQLLVGHRGDVAQRIAELEGHLVALDAKIDHYRQLLEQRPDKEHQR